MENQLSKFTLTELKALAYDQLAQIELSQNNMRLINQEMSNRLQTSNQQQITPKFEPLPVDSIQTV